jgi:hypothetical protein
MSDEKFLNSTPNYFCKICDVTYSKPSDWKRHLLTAKHKKLLVSDEKGEKVSADYACANCEYTCNKKSLWDKHIITAKHKRLSLDLAPSGYTCEVCNKNYSCYSSLWSHKRKCTPVDNHDLAKENQELRNFIMEQTRLYTANMNEIVEKNTEMLNKVVETCKPITNNNNTTINNPRFNINVFLNETCKDAINFSDFVKNIQISYEDLENNAQLGFVNGISKIFLDNLKQLDVNSRPIHCTDMKRETMYIKDDNTWTKQPDDEKLQKAIQTVSYRSMGKLAEWKQENPEYKDCNSEFSQKCLDIQRQTLAGSERGVYYPKVIHALARETIVKGTNGS